MSEPVDLMAALKASVDAAKARREARHPVTPDPRPTPADAAPSHCCFAEPGRHYADCPAQPSAAPERERLREEMAAAVWHVSFGHIAGPDRVASFLALPESVRAYYYDRADAIFPILDRLTAEAADKARREGPTDAEVEAGARVLFDCTDRNAEDCLRLARDVLTAAREVPR